MLMGDLKPCRLCRWDMPILLRAGDCEKVCCRNPDCEKYDQYVNFEDWDGELLTPIAYTSNFASHRKFPKEYSPVGIVRYQLKWVDKPCDKRLAPSEEMLKLYKAGKVSDQGYSVAYLKILNGLGIDKIKQIVCGKTLLCYCGKKAFCHRHVLRKYLNDNGVSCEEL